MAVSIARRVWDPFNLLCCAVQLTRRSLPIEVECAAAKCNNATTSLMTLYAIFQQHEGLQISRNKISTERFLLCPKRSFPTSIQHQSPSIPTINSTKHQLNHQPPINNPNQQQNGLQNQYDLNHNVILPQTTTALIRLRPIPLEHPNSTQSLLQQLLVQTPLLQLQNHPPLTLTIISRQPIPRNPQSLPPRRLLRQPHPRLRFKVHVASGSSIARRPPGLRCPSAGVYCGGRVETPVEEEQVDVCASGWHRWRG